LLAAERDAAVLVERFAAPLQGEAAAVVDATADAPAIDARNLELHAGVHLVAGGFGDAAHVFVEDARILLAGAYAVGAARPEPPAGFEVVAGRFTARWVGAGGEEGEGDGGEQGAQRQFRRHGRRKAQWAQVAEFSVGGKSWMRATFASGSARRARIARIDSSIRCTKSAMEAASTGTSTSSTSGR